MTKITGDEREIFLVTIEKQQQRIERLMNVARSAKSYIDAAYYNRRKYSADLNDAFGNLEPGDLE